MTNAALSRSERDALLARKTALQCEAERLFWSRPVRHLGDPETETERREKACRDEAAAIRVQIAGCSGDKWLSRYNTVMDRYVAGELTTAEWLEELRDLGLDATAAWTRLDRAREAERQKNLRRRIAA